MVQSTSKLGRIENATDGDFGDNQVEGYGDVPMVDDEDDCEQKGLHQEEGRSTEEGKSLDESTPETSPSPSINDEVDAEKMDNFNKVVQEIAETARRPEIRDDLDSSKRPTRSWGEVFKSGMRSLGGGTDKGESDQNSILFTVTSWKFAPRDDEGAELPDYVTTGQEAGDESSKANNSNQRTALQRACQIYQKNEISILICLSIVLAYAYPPLGAEYLQPQILTRWIVVPYVLFLVGMGMQVKQLPRARQRIKFYASVQLFSFGVDSVIIFGITRLIVRLNLISESLGDGMTICGCLSMSLSTVSVLTKKAGGHEPAAMINSTLGNLLGILLSPLLMIGYARQSQVILVDLVLGWGFGIIVPILLGILLQFPSGKAIEFLKKNRVLVSASRQYSVAFIVYTIFCLTFSQDGTDTTASDVFVMIVAQIFIFLVISALAWASFKFLVPFDPDLRVTAFFGCTQKTLPMGVPIICALFFNDNRAGLYILPLLVWYPIQVALSSLLASRLKRFVREETELLGNLSEAGSSSDTES